ncbi:methyltransferase domain-containing protein [Mesorhizobium sp. M8A.F.Ca.ET.021.01.1.1]|nr:methyltransferase domain-containing protein [Mesorhizobium sp. M8A.F.Ca.ET.021.01.1.1]
MGGTKKVWHAGLTSILSHFPFPAWAFLSASPSPLAATFKNKRDFASVPNAVTSVLEIGPFNNPCVRGENVSYFDVMTTEQLRARAMQVGYDPSTVPHIRYVSPVGDLGIVADQFDAVVSCHCIEHQPDLIAHFRQVHRILRPGGRYFLDIPDKRYCCDHFLTESSLHSIIEAKGDTRHPLTKVIEHRAFTTHSEAWRHWAGDHASPSYFDAIIPFAAKALKEYQDAQGGYIDVHRWQFTPASFRDIVVGLRQKEELAFNVVEVNDTARGDLEFTAVLEAA